MDGLFNLIRYSAPETNLWRWWRSFVHQNMLSQADWKENLLRYWMRNMQRSPNANHEKQHVGGRKFSGELVSMVDHRCWLCVTHALGHLETPSAVTKVKTATTADESSCTFYFLAYFSYLGDTICPKEVKLWIFIHRNRCRLSSEGQQL